MNVFIGTVIDGLTLGAIYSLAAVAFSLFCGTRGVFSFAPGGICLLGAMVSAVVASWISTLAPIFIPAALVAALPVSMTAGGAAGWLLNRGANVHGNSRHVWLLIASAGVLLSALGLLQLMRQLHIGLHVPSPVPLTLIFPGLFSVQIAIVKPLIMALAVAAMGLVAFVIGHTDFGIVQRAARYDASMAGLLGADTARVARVCTLTACVLAAISGWMLAADQGLPGPESGFLTIVCVLLSIVAGGGVGSLKGSAGFGFVTGLGQTFWSAYFSPAYAPLAVFAVVLFLVRFLPEREPAGRMVEDI
jgi:branched-subunit amino acid ABC-type transport system permease component